MLYNPKHQTRRKAGALNVTLKRLALIPGDSCKGYGPRFPILLVKVWKSSLEKVYSRTQVER